MFLRWLLLCLFGCALCPLSVHAQGDFTRYRDKNRRLLIFAPTASDPRLQKQSQLLASGRAAFGERDLRRFEILGRSASAARERARYKISRAGFEVLLIGKDGHVALRRHTPVALADITGLIDQMPMRREEMRRQEERHRQAVHRPEKKTR